MGVTIDKEKLLIGLREYGETDKFKAKYDEIMSLGWLGRIAKCLSFVPDAVGIAEKSYNDLDGMRGEGGKSKRDAVVEWIDDIIKLPFWAETLDGMVIGWAVDAFVAWLNFAKGRNWLDTAKDFLGIE